MSVCPAGTDYKNGRGYPSVFACNGNIGSTTVTKETISLNLLFQFIE